MNALALIESLDRFGRVLPAVIHDISANNARWKPADGAWSILEIACHLLDEEVRDFRGRLRLVLDDPRQAWPAIDPEGWAVVERYNDRALGPVVERWVAERRESIAWLRGLKAVDWSVVHQHPKIGPLRAGDLLVSWVQHDALHLRQIAKRLHQLAGRDGGEFSGRYAGEWRA